MKYRVDELEGALLDAAVAMAEGKPFEITPAWEQRPAFCQAQWLKLSNGDDFFSEWAPSSNWSIAGLIIERERITLHAPDSEFPTWNAVSRLRPVRHEKDAPCWGSIAETPLIAAMRCYVKSKLGSEVEIPAPLAEGGAHG